METDDFCNICEKKASLTWDHVPPQITGNKLSVKIKPLFPQISNQKKAFEISQNGLKYKTLCSSCNSQLLGSIYDKEYGNLCKKIKMIFLIKNRRNNIFKFKVEVNKIARSVVGHLLAAKTEYDSNVLIDKELRKYFLNQSELPPSNYQLCFYFYPYETIVVQRDVAIGSMGKQIEPIPKGLISCIYQFPLAFILTDDSTSWGMQNLFDYCTKNIDDLVEITIDFNSAKYKKINKIRNPYWPFNVSDEDDGVSFALTHNNAVKSSAVAIKNIK